MLYLYLCSLIKIDGTANYLKSPKSQTLKHYFASKCLYHETSAAASYDDDCYVASLNIVVIAGLTIVMIAGLTIVMIATIITAVFPMGETFM